MRRGRSRQCDAWRVLACGVCLCAASGASAETATASAPGAKAPLVASARLDFIIDIGKFLFFRLGTGGYPTASSSVDTVAFDLVPGGPVGGLGASDGSDLAVTWTGGPPTFTCSATNNAVQVELRSNAGPIALRASVLAPLASGPDVISFSAVSVASSDADLPAPPIPDSGTGTSLTVTGTDFSGQVTVRSAQWLFSYTPASPPIAGSYQGQLGFTASSP